MTPIVDGIQEMLGVGNRAPRLLAALPASCVHGAKRLSSACSRSRHVAARFGNPWVNSETRGTTNPITTAMISATAATSSKAAIDRGTRKALSLPAVGDKATPMTNAAAIGCNNSRAA